MIFGFEETAGKSTAPEEAVLICAAGIEGPHELQDPIVNFSLSGNARFVIGWLLGVGGSGDGVPGFAAIERAMHFHAEVAMTERRIERAFVPVAG